MVKGHLLRSILNASDQPLLIRPPRAHLFAVLLRRWAELFVIALTAYSFFMMVAAPVFVHFLYAYYLFAKDWKRYGYSSKLLHGGTALFWIASVAAADPLRTYIGSVFR